MEQKLQELNDDFKHIVNIREDVISIMSTISQRIDKLKEMYGDFIKNNKKNLFIFGLDTFHFQNKLIDIEYDDMKRMFYAISNRIYCEYYKLHKIIIEYILHHVSDKKIIETIQTKDVFPVYKDLEPFKQYNFEYVQEIHENIILSLKTMCNYLTSKNYELENHENKVMIGLNINNFVNTFSYDIFVMREKVNLFISYVDFFHNLHTKFLERFSKKMNFMLEQLNADIKFDKREKKENIELEIEIDKNERSIKKMFQQSVKKVGNILNMSPKKSIVEKNKSLDTFDVVDAFKEMLEENDDDKIIEVNGRNIITKLFNPIEEMNSLIEEKEYIQDVEAPVEAPVEATLEAPVEAPLETHVEAL